MCHTFTIITLALERIKNVEESKKSYCRSEDSCLRKQLLEYFGFSSVQQDKCCCICDEKNTKIGVNLPQILRNKVRSTPNDNCIILERSIKSIIAEHGSPATLDCSMLFDISGDKNATSKVIVAHKQITRLLSNI